MGFETRNKYQEERFFQRRIAVVAVFVLVCFSVLFVRFVWLQVFHYDVFSKRVDINRLRIVSVGPVRGAIIDRNGVVLAYNASTYTMEITPSKVKNLDETIEQLRTIVPITERDVRRFRRAMGQALRRDNSIPLRWHLTQEEVAHLSAQLYRFPGVGINARFIRKYPLGETASHVLGYIGNITEADRNALAESNEIENYQGTQNIGRVGIEASYEKVLHGTKGIEELEVNSRGIRVRRLREIAPSVGDIVQLTLDARLQRLVETLYGKRRGAFVAMDPRTGEVLALVSMPRFDPNMFIEGFDQEGWDMLNEALDQPFFHRAIGGTYPIGSTYKPFMVLAGMQTGTRAPEKVVIDPGYFELAGRRWKSSGGSFNATQAIIKSNNYYFYSLAYEMGVTGIYDFMKPWGFGQLTGIDLGGEVRGVLPSIAWKQQRWFDGDTVNLGIGQGFNRFTLIQLASALATLANDGVKFTPHLLLNTKDVGSGVVEPNSPGDGVRMDIDAAYIDVVKQAMAQVPIQGTGRTSFTGAPYTSGGKTGTAQAMSIPPRARYNPATLSEYNLDHSLYIAFAPAEDPQIVVALIVENAGFGATAAVPIARRALDYFLLGVYPSEADIKAVQQGRATAPRGEPRPVDRYDIIEAEQLIPLSTIEFDTSATHLGRGDSPENSQTGFVSEGEQSGAAGTATLPKRARGAQL